MARRHQRITLADVAREADVSTMTVSRVINGTGRISDDTREHVQTIIDKLGYRPNRAARTLVTNRTYTVGFVVPDITNPYFTEILQGVEEFFWQEGYNVLLGNTNEDPEREEAVLSQLEETTIDGLIVCSRLPDNVLFRLIEKHPAVVVLNRDAPQHIASVVNTRHSKGFRSILAAKYLHNSGRRKIGYISLIRGSSLIDVQEFAMAVEEDGIEINFDWYDSCAPSWNGGYDAGKRLLQNHPELDALIGGNDLVALGAMRAALDLGRQVPEDLGVVGGDDILMSSQVSPPLTTFRVDKFEVGTQAAQLLLYRMEGDKTYREHRYHYDEELIIRGST